jgi:hypothetical protein
MSQKEMEREEKGNAITSQRATWTIEKTKQLPTIGTTGYYYVLPQEGRIDQERELIDIAIELDIIQRRGAWYNLGDSKWNGMSNIELTEEQAQFIIKQIND